MTNQVLVENDLCDSLLAFSPPHDLCRLVCILLCIKCLDALLMLGFFVWGCRDSRFTTRKFYPIYQDEVVFVFFRNDMIMVFSELISFMVIILLLKNRVEA